MVKNVLLLAIAGSLAVVEAKGFHRERRSSNGALHRRITYSLQTPEESWDQSLFEPYVRYHARYMAINCPNQHNTAFFEKCCHPRRAGQEDDGAYGDECSKPVSGAPKPDAAAVKVEAKVYAPLVADGQTGFGGGAVKAKSATSSKNGSTSTNTTTTVDADAQKAKAKAEAEAKAKADAKAKAEAKAKADADAEAQAEAAKKAAADAKKAADEETKQAAEKAAQRAAALKAKLQAEADAKAKEAEAAKEKAEEEAQKAKDDASQKASTQSVNNDDDDDEDDDKSSGGGGGGLGGLFSNIVGELFNNGEATWFEQDSTGACGNDNSDSVPLVALGPSLYGNMDAVSPNCGRMVLIQNTANGKSVKAKVQDACPPCDKTHIDLSLSAFDAIGARDTGVLPIKWAFIS